MYEFPWKFYPAVLRENQIVNKNLSWLNNPNPDKFPTSCKCETW